jgi:hypothetical protein
VFRSAETAIIALLEIHAHTRLALKKPDLRQAQHSRFKNLSIEFGQFGVNMNVVRWNLSP